MRKKQQKVLSVLRLFKDRYHIENFREMYLHVTLVDKQGDAIELVDNETDETYRIFEVYRNTQELLPRSPYHSKIKLVIDNTKNNLRST